MAKDITLPEGDVRTSAPADAAAPAAKTGTASPHEHAKALGSFAERKARGGSVVVSSLNGQSVSNGVYSWQHAAAAALHGWAEHEHHEAKPIQLSADDYKAALLAASAPVIRSAVDFSGSVPNGKGNVSLSSKKGDKIDLQKLDLSTADLASAGVAFTADYEPHTTSLSKHAVYSKAKADR